MSETWDYIVIGSGSAGSVIATRLSEDPSVRVLVLEAGGSDDKFFYKRPGALAFVYEVPQLKESADWGYKTVPLPAMLDREMPYTRGKIVGGCSTVNGMLYIRGNKANYDRWAELGNEGWSYADVLPLFKKSEGHRGGADAFHGADGPLQVTAPDDNTASSVAFIEAVGSCLGVPTNVDFNGADQEGAGIYHMTCADRRRSSASVAFLKPAIAERANLTMITGVLVSRLELDGTRVTGVTYLQDGAPHTVHASSEVVLSAGAIGSPWILQLSGIGPAEHLRSVGVEVRHDLPGVGENLQDHLFCPVSYDAKKSTVNRSTAPYFLAGMFRDMVFNKGWFGKTFMEAGCFIKSDPSKALPDLQFMSLPWAYPVPNDDEGTDSKIARTPTFTLMPALIYPKSRGTLRLQSADPTVAPLVDPGFLTDPEDLEVLVRGVKLAREIAATEPLASMLTTESFPGPSVGTDEEIRQSVRYTGKTVYHPVGTCKMGPDSDPMAVVDQELRCRGLQGLRIADASIMPEIVGGNTNAPSIMIGEKCAELIRAGAGTLTGADTTVESPM